MIIKDFFRSTEWKLGIFAVFLGSGLALRLARTRICESSPYDTVSPLPVCPQIDNIYSVLTLNTVFDFGSDIILFLLAMLYWYFIASFIVWIFSLGRKKTQSQKPPQVNM